MKKVSRKVEDYLETLYLIQKKKGYLKVRDIAAAMDVKPPSVVEMLRKLGTADLVSYEKYGAITLTKKGMEIGKNTVEKHETFRKFLTFIGLPEKTASDDACEMEHHLHPETITQFIEFVGYLENSKEGKKCREEFIRYIRTRDLKHL